MMRPTRFGVLLSVVLILGAGLLRAANPPPSELFREGDRWSIVGDSITHNGAWHAWVYAYYATRFPEMTLDAMNCGISGDTAAGAVRRHAWDIRPRRGTVATVMLGMNDVQRSLYADAEPSSAMLARRAAALDSYRENITELVRLLRADGSRVVLMTPTIFDETAELAAPRQAGVNGALETCARFLHEFGAEQGLPVIDLNRPMAELNRALQKKDPAFTLVGPDRIHPGAAGHLVVAYHVLKAQQAPPVVSRVAIDAAALRVEEANNAEVRDLRRTERGLDFSLLERALPCPIDAAARRALDWVPFEEDFNQQRLQVTGLADGDYALTIDGTLVRTYSASELATGVNLAEEPATPQNRQAMRVLELIKKWRGAVASVDRTLAQVEHGLVPDAQRPITYATMLPLVEAELAKYADGKARQAAYYTNLYGRYLKTKANEAAERAALDGYRERIHDAAKPVAHAYALTWVASRAD